MNELDKVRAHAEIIIKALQKENSTDTIKGSECQLVVNPMTNETLGFAISLQVSTKFTYTEELLEEWKERFWADHFHVKVVRNQLWLMFRKLWFVSTEAHISRMNYALGLDGDTPGPHRFWHEVHRNCSVYCEPDGLWEDLVIAGFAKVERRKGEYFYSLTAKGVQFLANHRGIGILSEPKLQGRAKPCR